MFLRALAGRCPNCGGRGILGRWMALVDHCPACGHRFERHEGYWVGAVAINTAVTIVVFAAVFVGAIVITWPDVPWTGILIATVSLNVAFPIVFYPWSKTLWVATDLAVHPPEARERDEAALRLADADGATP